MNHLQRLKERWRERGREREGERERERERGREREREITVSRNDKTKARRIGRDEESRRRVSAMYRQRNREGMRMQG